MLLLSCSVSFQLVCLVVPCHNLPFELEQLCNQQCGLTVVPVEPSCLQEKQPQMS